MLRLGRSIRGSVAIAVLTMVTTGLLVSPSSASAAATKKGGDLSFLISSEPVSLDPKVVDPSTSNGSVSVTAFSIYDNLIRIDPETGKTVPRIAESLTANADATQWTVKIRKNVRFTDGTTLDAQAVKANWDRLANPATAATVAGSISGWTWTVSDAYTIKVVLPVGLGAFPYYMASTAMTYIASPAALSKFGSSYGSTPDTTVGAGPFKLSEWVRGDHITEVRNSTFWDSPRPYLDSVTFKPVADLSQKSNALLAGQADAVWMTTIGPDSQRLSDAGFKAYGATSPNNIGILFNPSRAPFDDVRVRQALVLATDVDDLNAKAGAGLAPVVGTWYSKESPMYDASVKRPATNLAKAQKLVNEYVASKGPIKSSFICAQSIGAWCTALQQQWARLSNVDIQVNLLVPAQNVTLGQTGNYNANMTQSPNPGDWPEGFYKQLGSGQAGNVIHYSNPDLDKVLAASRSYTNVAQRKQALSKITRIITDDALFNPIFHNLNQTFVQKNVKGVQLHDPTIIDTTTLKLAKSN